MATTPLTQESILMRLKISNKILGTGSFAAVHRGTWDGRPCAVKVLLPQHANRPRDPKRSDCPAQMLKREGNMLMRYPHRSLVTCYAVLELHPGFPGLPAGYKCSAPALVLEYLQNGSLYKLLLQQQQTPWSHMYDDRTAMSWSIQIASALAHLHGLSPAIIHRDVKLENAMLNREEAQEGGAGGEAAIARVLSVAGANQPLVKLVDLGLHVAASHLADEQLFRAAMTSSSCDTPSGTAGSTQSPFLCSSTTTVEVVSSNLRSRSPPLFTRATYSGGGGGTISAAKSLRRCGTSGRIGGDIKAAATAGTTTANAIAGGDYSSGGSKSSMPPLFLALVPGSSRMLRVDPRSPGLRNRNAALILSGHLVAEEAKGDTRAGPALGGAGENDPSVAASFERFNSTTQRELSGFASSSSMCWVAAAGAPYSRSETQPTRAFQYRELVTRPGSGLQRQLPPPPPSPPHVTATESLQLAQQMRKSEKRIMKILNKQEQQEEPPSAWAGLADEVLDVTENLITAATGAAAVTNAATRTTTMLTTAMATAMTNAAKTPSALDTGGYGSSSDTSYSGGAGEAAAVAEDVCRGDGGAEAALLCATEWTSMNPPPSPRLAVSSPSMNCATARVMRLYESSVPVESVYRLTGATGSHMTMAPEVYQGLPYNEKADVFSFGVILYELFGRSLLLVTHINTRKPGLPAVMQKPGQYAEAVSQGYRPERTACIPAPVWDLITECWNQDPLARPTMADAELRLREISNQMDNTGIARGARGGGASGIRSARSPRVHVGPTECLGGCTIG
ncbi:hypothetical protein Vafri_4711 [Volvox africanus]|uniref:Protein kinase domain-containing protein n=1 Tax=Volvox africanus TaxID=51714 RepID=A0A8J4AUI3_9CHLO|nr:hypothetical protein Vafri_4711 [Volvox africanus]